ncbi:intraflagellar transport protein 46 homolog isoform X3 [Lineus longissimus]|uniref:intraflagellar transport protein 46 homolog isoform X3 n=1 Tax=Lineus longissimus TaxID=88925 RepID=UPI002B4DD8BA
MDEEFEEDRANARLHQNQPYDESLDVPDAEEVASTYTPTPRAPAPGRGRSRGETPPDSRMTDVDNSEEDFDTGQQDMNMMGAMAPPGQGLPRPVGQIGGLERGGTGAGVMPLESKPQKPQQFMDDDDDDDEDGSDTDDDDDDDDEDDDDDDPGVALEGAYDPADYDHLPVVPEIKELFQYITRYTPQAIELEHKLKPFIPDFIPAVGDIDAFIKITRPDNKPDDIGLKVLDEPCAKQSDPTVLDLHLRSISKQTNLKAVSIKSVENAEKNPKAIDSWIESITELHRSKPPPNVHYTKNMPDIETLMQEWPPEFEDLLKEVGLPTAEVDCDLGTYVDMICAILDIPVNKSKIQSLHVLFTLYSEFKNSQHFKSLAESNQLDNVMGQNDFMGGGGEGEDRLIL